MNILRANLIKVYSMGMNFWHQPIKLNEIFVQDVCKVIE